MAPSDPLNGACTTENASSHVSTSVAPRTTVIAVPTTVERLLFAAIGRGPWVAGYQDGAGVAQRIDGVRRRLGFPRLTPDEQARFGEALETLREHAEAALAAIEEGGRRRDCD